ncbi:16S rRNA (adenine(1518)-N(6)/adenine(1519)-N(6))-dimethyltransferase RsmA [Calditrichota bacterium]
MKAKKHLGQNFLRNPAVANDIANLVPVEYPVIEIGPGDGSLTDALLGSGHRVVGIEIDPEMIRRLKYKFQSRRDFRVHSENITNVEWKDVWLDEPRISVVGNLPYHIASVILFKVFDHVRSGAEPLIMNITFMVQLEVGQRIAASQGDENYSALSLLARYHGTSRLAFKVDRDEFQPRPKVNGGVVTMNFTYPFSAPNGVDYAQFRRIVRGSFSQRRKMMRNCLQALGPLPDGWEDLPFDFKLRPQQMAFEQFLDLTAELTMLTEKSVSLNTRTVV